MPHREELHRLIEQIPPQELPTALRFLQFLAGTPEAARLLVVDDPGHAPEPPESPEEHAAWSDYESHLKQLRPLDQELEPD